MEDSLEMTVKNMMSSDDQQILDNVRRLTGEDTLTDDECFEVFEEMILKGHMQ